MSLSWTRHAMTTHRILIVDDDARATATLSHYLARFDIAATGVIDAQAMQAQLLQATIQLVVLSLALPGLGGLEAVRMLRRQSNIPLILLTAPGDAADRIVGLETGADDCMARPIEPRELVARIHNVLRRAAREPATQTTASQTITRFDGWRLDRDERRLTSPAGTDISLSNAEFQLLATFLTQPRQVLSRDQLAERAQGRPAGSVARSIDLLVSRLRQKFADGSAEADPPLIKTVRGDGYLLNAHSVSHRISP
jgi:two-component system OmpR family response regulator